jgi:adenosylcobinamide kinase / adenosylcobinamide-phosphate guanylyltransferase
MITLILGGARSGKSAVAERLVAKHPEPITYVATMAASDDPDLLARIVAHQRRRPEGWQTVEGLTDLPGVLRHTTGSVLLDSLGPWVAYHDETAVDVSALCSALLERAGDTVVVSDEVGLGVHPSSDAGRHFRDALGSVNHAVAEVAQEVLLVVAGRVLRLDELD